MTKISIEDITTFCKKKGFVYPSSEIYGGMAGFFDYGPLGVELKNNIKQQWWKYHVNNRTDIVGLDGSIITNPKIWKASGHIDCFEDILIECKKCKSKFKGDVLLEEKLKICAEGLDKKDIDKLIIKNKITCPNCKGKFANADKFNLMFQTFVGPKQNKDSLAYLRPETAQIIFANFKLIAENSRLKLPFGIAQIGKAFRNEISPRNFLFRTREFEQMEIEYFIHPKKKKSCPYIKEFSKYKLKILSKKMKKEKEMTISSALNKKIIHSPWHAYWLALEHKWLTDLGIKSSNLRIRQHNKKELAHYSTDCWDLEYHFPFGWKEIQGIADRGDFDLTQHIKHSKKNLELFDEESKEKVIANVIAEPSIGVGRAFLIFLFDSYQDDKKRGNIVLKLDPKIAPIKVAILPLVNKLNASAQKVFELLKQDFICTYDKSGSIGRRYARQDEIGTPICITIDFDTLENKTVTLRDLNTTSQIRLEISKLKKVIPKILGGEKIKKFGKIIK